jgi:hypothetical protein
LLRHLTPKVHDRDLAENLAVLCHNRPWLLGWADKVFQRRGHRVSDQIRVLFPAVGNAVSLCFKPVLGRNIRTAVRGGCLRPLHFMRWF